MSSFIDDLEAKAKVALDCADPPDAIKESNAKMGAWIRVMSEYHTAANPAVLLEIFRRFRAMQSALDHVAYFDLGPASLMVQNALAAARAPRPLTVLRRGETWRT